ncbi:hypothetical protein ACROYT_G037456 [Oculina patagonica]
MKARNEGACNIVCMKTLFFVFNFLFWLAGIGILGVGIWIMVYKSDYQSLLDSDIYVIVPGLMIAAGVVVIIVGIVGCIGAAKENRFFLISFLVMVSLIFILELTIGILAFVYSTKIKDELKTTIKDKMNQQYGVNEDVTKSIDKLQKEVEALTDKAPWQAIAEALKQGPTLPKIELMKFGGDPSEYGEFVANFRDHIESQVSDDSQRLTRLLAQCVGKVRDAIKSCVNLPIGQRYSEAWKTLSKNFGQPHMVADAHMKRLREYNLRRVDAASLMDFARKLEDTKRVLTSMGPLYVSRLDNEDTILMLMKKLPDEGLKRKWTDVAGDLICSKGQVDFSDFVNFIQKRADRLNNRFGQELKSSLPQHEKERRHGNKDKQDLPFKATTLATQSKGNRKSPNTGSATLKCYQCSGPHTIWQCETFKNASY